MDDFWSTSVTFRLWHRQFIREVLVESLQHLRQLVLDILERLSDELKQFFIQLDASPLYAFTTPIKIVVPVHHFRLFSLNTE